MESVIEVYEVEDLLREWVGLPYDEEFIKAEEDKMKAGKMSAKGKEELLRMLTDGKLDDCNMGGGMRQEN